MHSWLTPSGPDYLPDADGFGDRFPAWNRRTLCIFVNRLHCGVAGFERGGFGEIEQDADQSGLGNSTFPIIGENPC